MPLPVDPLWFNLEIVLILYLVNYGPMEMSLKPNVSEALEWSKISHDDCNTVIQALFATAPTRSNVEIDWVFDSRGGPVANASISRKFD